MDLKATYNKIAQEWHASHQADDWWVDGTNAFISMLKPGALVLDAGCAAGTKSRYLIDRGLRVVGIDIADNFIEIARREVPGGEFIVRSMEEINTMPQNFDAIFMQASLLHIPRAQAPLIVKSAVTKLNPQGLFYIAVKEVREGKPMEEVKTENDYGYEYQRFFSYFTVHEIKDMMQAAGLQPVYENVTPAGRSRWIQVIGRK